MDILLESLGEEGAKQFLHASLPHIQQYHANLLAAMSAQDWTAAAACAHLLKGTATLYATQELISLLQKIINKDHETISSIQFLEILQASTQATEIKIKSYLS
jgi:hypothetical protein